MKKSIILTLCFLLVSLATFAGKFILIPVTETNNLESLFNNNDLKIHYYNDNYVLATAEVLHYDNSVVLDENAFGDVDSYAIVYCYNDLKEEYVSKIPQRDIVLYSGDNFLLMKILSNDFMPAKNDGMVAIMDIEAKLPKSSFDFPVITEPDEIVLGLLEEVSQEGLIATVQTMQDFQTRNCIHANSILAQNWIKEQYESLGLEASFHTFTNVYPWWGGQCVSDNVIGIQYGTEFPDEYIVCGCHFDSFVYGSTNNAPGADDNATGVATVLEMARILSQYEFKRSIIYCSFTAEECGLYGSGYYAQDCANQGKNILGYFNIDMTGYLRLGDPIHISLIYPSSAEPLANYNNNITDIYFPDIPITPLENLTYGDSDHTSFNQKGYMGIWTFEDWTYDSPHIHTTNDIIGPSVNNAEQVKVFTQVNLASIATLALFNSVNPPPPIVPPTNCEAEYIEDEGIKITWKAPEENTPDEYYVYRDSAKIFQTVELSYLDDEVEDYDLHCYMVTAVYDINDYLYESGYSNVDCDSIPFIDNIIEYNSNFKIYPNPTTGELTIDNGEWIIEKMTIIDMMGKTLTNYQFSILNSQLKVDVSHLPAGIYFIKIENEFIGKFVKW